MKPIASNVQLLWQRRDFQRLKDAHAFPDMFSADPACRAGLIDLFEAFMPEATDHYLRVNEMAYSVNRSVDTVALWMTLWNGPPACGGFSNRLSPEPYFPVTTYFPIHINNFRQSALSPLLFSNQKEFFPGREALR
jgi:hypothetical protein